jgi:hypothetical protein
MEMTVKTVMIIVIGLLATLLIVSLILTQGSQSNDLAMGLFDWIRGL